MLKLDGTNPASAWLELDGVHAFVDVEDEPTWPGEAHRITDTGLVGAVRDERDLLALEHLPNRIETVRPKHFEACVVERDLISRDQLEPVMRGVTGQIDRGGAALDLSETKYFDRMEDRRVEIAHA